VYDPIAGCLRQTLTSPECQATEHAHFIGASGRHLVAAGAKTITLWDLIKSQGTFRHIQSSIMAKKYLKVLWQTTTSSEIDRIIAHPRENSFAVFHCSTFNQDRDTKVSIFHVPSYIPAATFLVPFGLQNVIWNSIGKGAGYNLVGITHDWRVVILGDTQLPSRDDNLPQGLDISDRSEKRTLFEDIFGSSAFASGDSESSQSISTMSSHVRKLEGSRHQLFDKPAYLMPALDTLFDPLVTSLLRNRISEVDPKIPEADDEEDEDITMIDDTVQPPLFATHSTRIPNQGEMELFTQLFRKTSITSTYTHSFLPRYIFMIVLKSSITFNSAGFFESQW
jgi:NET1-associated nuclear protein 1 (U3 small nucleolar RNA-associated protein 17)